MLAQRETKADVVPWIYQTSWRNMAVKDIDFLMTPIYYHHTFAKGSSGSRRMVLMLYLAFIDFSLALGLELRKWVVGSFTFCVIKSIEKDYAAGGTDLFEAWSVFADGSGIAFLEAAFLWLFDFKWELGRILLRVVLVGRLAPFSVSRMVDV